MNKVYCFILTLIFAILLIGKIPSMFSIAFAQGDASESQSRALQSTSDSLDVIVAPGELLPVSVRLSNFGGGKRVDVTVTYLITSEKGAQIYKTTETVAVETTNNFIKTIQIPTNAKPGNYSAKTSIQYQGQKTPATTQFSFRVERKYLGLFQNDFFLYGGGTLLISLLIIISGYYLVERKSPSRFAPIDYSNIPRKDRVFYELISDTVLGMRQKVGDQAFEIASKVPGLIINKDSGKVVKLSESPSKIVAELVSGYEKTLGKKVSFSFRKPSSGERR